MSQSQPDWLIKFLETTERYADNPIERWKLWLGQKNTVRLGFEDCQFVWKTLFDDYSKANGSPPIWAPGLRELENSNLSFWLQETGCADVAELHRWSVINREQFWEIALEQLEIACHEEPSSIFSESAHRQSPDVLSHAKLNIFESCFQASPDQIAVISGQPGGQIEYHSYGELQTLANQVSNMLLDEGYAVGDRLGIILPMTYESIGIYLGIIQAGMVAVSIADSFAAPEVSNRLQIADAKGVFTYEKLGRAGKEFPLLERVKQATELPVIVVKDSGGNWDRRISRQSADFTPVIGDPFDPVNILFSSGTTGEPKAIPWNHTTPIKCAIDGMLHHDLHPGDVVAWPTNLGWMMGPWLIFATLINRGTIAVYDDAPFGPDFGKFIQDARVNMLGLVPSLVRLWRKEKSMESFDWSAIHCFSSTGEASNADDMVYLSWLAGFRPIIEYCGGTEIGGGYISSTVIQPNVPAAFSTPAFGLDVCILDEQGVEADEGELFLVPPSIGLSVELLNRNHDETYFSDCPTDSDGRRLRRHGDYFRRLPTGYYAAGGRADDTMNLGGIKVSSVEIEKCLNDLDEISESAAVAVHYEHSGPDQLVVFYVPSADVDAAIIDHSELLKKMNQAVRFRLNPLFKIRSIHPKKALPRTASNKVMRRLLRDELQIEKK